MSEMLEFLEHYFQGRKGFVINGQSTLRGIFVLENSVSQRCQHEDVSCSPLYDSSESFSILDTAGMQDEMRW